MVARLYSFGLCGMEAFVVTIEVDISKGLPGFEIVGLPDAAVRESRDRVRSAMKNCGYDFPVSRITMNLAPADIKKSGPLYDLPLLLSMLCATGQLEGEWEDSAFLGELSLTGEVRPVNGVLPMAIAAKEHGFRRIFVPRQNAAEGAAVEGIQVFGVSHVKELTAFLSGAGPLEPVSQKPDFGVEREPQPDFCDVKGQQGAKRALEIAAAGGHNALLIGPPGSGKSMLAKRLPSILPDMSFEESIETTKIHSIAGILPPQTPLIVHRPFRAPHHTISAPGLAGGGNSQIRPGEISLAHNGVLFLDELPEFSRTALEVLRQPMEDSKVTISRVNGSLSYPCSVMVVAAMNPCPCGYFGHPARPCTCTPQQVSRYLSRVSGPLLDRLDLHIDVLPVEFSSLTSTQKAEPSAAIKKRVDAARKRQQERFAGQGISCNARMKPGMLAEACPMTDQAETLLKNAFERMGLSARAYDRILKVARTIADLDGEDVIAAGHIAEAVQYRSLDRKYWLSDR